MKQPLRLSKYEYAQSYDRVANELYRLALYLLGDVDQARQVMANLFVKGFVAQKKIPFEQAMLKTLWLLVEDSQPAYAERYFTNLLDASALSSYNEDCIRLFEMLGTMQLVERAVLLLTVVEQQQPDLIAWVLNLPQGELSRMNQALSLRIRKTMAA